MQVRFLIDADTELPHIYNHGVTEQEAIDVIERPGLLLKGSGGSFMALGQTATGRYLKVVYRTLSDELFVITAIDLRGKEGISASTTRQRNMKKDPNVYPPGLNAKKVRQILEHYENQSDEDAAIEISTAPSASETTWIPVPSRLVPKIRKLIAKEA